MRINQNIAAFNAYRNLNTTQNQLGRSLEKLSSGFRINRAADDAAGLVKSENLRAEIRGTDQAVANAQDGISMVQTAEGALNEVHAILQRMRELAVSAANETSTGEAEQAEVAQLRAELGEISNRTQFAGIKLLDGSLAAISADDTVNPLAPATPVTQTGIANSEAGFVQLDLGEALDFNEINAGDTISVNFALDGEYYSLGLTTDGDAITMDVVERVNTALGADADAYNVTYVDGVLRVEAREPGELASAEITFVRVMRPNVDISADALTGSGTYVVTGGAEARVFVGFGANDAFQPFTLNNNDVIRMSFRLGGEDYSVDLTWNASLNEGAGGIAQDADAFRSLVAEAGLPVEHYYADVFTEFGGTFFDIAALEDGEDLTAFVSLEVFGLRPIEDAVDLTDNTDAATGLTDGQPELLVIDLAGQVAATDEGRIDVELTLGGTTQTYTVSATSTDLTDATLVAQSLAGMIAVEGFEATASGSQLSITSDTNRADTITIGTVAHVVPGSAGGTMAVFQVGANAGDTLSVSFASVATTSAGLDLDGIDVRTSAGASAALTTLDGAIVTVSRQRADLGAIQNRLEHTIANLQVASENLAASESRIRDTDMAAEMVTFTRSQILQQAGTAMLAQANQVPQSVLALLR